MFDFMNITNRVITEELKGKINLVRVDHYIRDGIMTLRLIYYVDDLIRKSFSYGYHPRQPHYPSHSNYGPELAEDFRIVIRNKFNL